MAVSPTLAHMLSSAVGTGEDFNERMDIVRAVRHGLPAAVVDNLVADGALSYAEIDRVVLPRKTLAHRKQLGLLTPDQSDRMVRVARIIADAQDCFGSAEKAHQWLRRPTAALAGEVPLHLLDTEEGARAVETLLLKIGHGIAA